MTDHLSGLVTVIVPVYNAESYLAETLDSVLRQTHVGWHCIVMDDGSTDATPGIARDFAERDPRFTVLAQANAGVTVARNRALAAVPQGTAFVAFLDGDDLWTSDALEVLVTALSSDPDAVGVYGTAEYMDATGRPVRPGSHPAKQRDRRVLGRVDLTSVDAADPTTFSTLLVVNTIWPPAVALHRRDAVEAVDGFDTSFVGGEDWDLYLRMSRLGHFRAIDRQVAWYRRHVGNVTGASVVMGQELDRVRWKAWVSADNTRAQRREAARVFRRLALRWTVWTLLAAVDAARRRHVRAAGAAVAAGLHFARQLLRGHPTRSTRRDVELALRYIAAPSQSAGGELP